MASDTVARTARRLRNKVLAMEDGEFLGYEESLMREFGVSRPTFRQVARVLSHEQLLTIKRGVGGGFYVRRPDCESVGQSVSTYLHSRDTTLLQAMEAMSMLRLTAESLQSDDPEVASRVEALHTQLAGVDPARETVANMVRRDREFTAVMGLLCGNPAIELCLRMFNQFASDTEDYLIWEGPEGKARIDEWTKLRFSIIDAIKSGRTVDAEQLLHKRGRLLITFIEQWMAENHC